MNTEIILHQLLRGGSSLPFEIPADPRAAGVRSATLFPHTENFSYDLTVTAATSLSIPVIGTVSGGASRRVVVLERRSYRKQTVEEGTEYVGYAIRLAVTVNKVEASTKMTFPFLAASAEIGQIEGRWAVQVVGLAGPKIDEALIPPAELSVEQYFKAKECLKSVIEAIPDPTTQILEQRIFFEANASQEQKLVDESLGRAYGLSCLDKKWKLQKALSEVNGARQPLLDAIVEIYGQVAGIQSELEDVQPAAQTKARQLLSEIREVNPR